jgi:assimilatory nitrate reductase catalytic subunit
LSAFENNGERDFDIGALAVLTDEAYDALDPLMWPARAREQRTEKRFFADGGFFSRDGRARFVAPEPPAPHIATDEKYPFRLNTGRMRDQWHTMTRTGASPLLCAHSPVPCVEVHPADAKAKKLTDGGFAKISTRDGSAVLKVAVTPGQRRRALFAPIHWNDTTASHARVGEMVAAATDPFSGQPEMKATPAQLEPAEFAYRGFALTRQPIALPDGTWFARVAVIGGEGMTFATNAPPDFCVFVGPARSPPQWDVVRSLFDGRVLSERERSVLLSGRSGEGLAEQGPAVCVCFGIGRLAIEEAVAKGSATVADVGCAIRAGTNCGSCVPELRAIIDERAAK